MEKSQGNRLKEIVSSLTSNRGESLYQSFLIGTAYIRYKMDEKTLLTFTQGIEQLVQLSTSMGRQDIVDELYSGILAGKQEAPIKFVETLTDKLFQQDGLGFNKNNSNNNDEEQFRRMMEEEQMIENERQKQDEQLARQAAQQMEEEDRKNLQYYKKMENLDNESWKCEICLEQMTDAQFWPLECKHQFHRDCLQQYFNVKIKDRNFPLKCPNQQCLIDVDYRDIKEILSKPDFQKYEEFQLNTYIDSNLVEISWCPSAGCKYAFVLEDNQTQLICPLCRKRYCLTCKCEYHKNQTCKEYQVANTYSEQDKRFEQFVRGQKFKQCLSCKMWVEKNQGCDHMRCRCGCEFCYKCGGPYMKCACYGHQN